MPQELEITYARSKIGYSERHRRTLAALGLRKLHDSVRRPDNPSVRGMVSSIRHMVTWRELQEGE